MANVNKTVDVAALELLCDKLECGDANHRATAAQIMADMKARNKRRKPPCGNLPNKNGRSVMVDGVVYPSINAAGRAMGVDGYYLGKRLREGKRAISGHDVRFVEDRR